MRLVHMLERTEQGLVEESFDFAFTLPSVVRSGRPREMGRRVTWTKCASDIISRFILPFFL